MIDKLLLCLCFRMDIKPRQQFPQQIPTRLSEGLGGTFKSFEEIRANERNNLFTAALLESEINRCVIAFVKGIRVIDGKREQRVSFVECFGHHIQ